MSDSLTPPTKSDATTPEAPAGQADELRELLIGPERKRLDQLEQQLEDKTVQSEKLSEVLPRALQLRSEKDDRLVPALQGTVEAILHSSVKKNPRFLAEALFPIIGPAIRKSIAATLRDMLSTFERALNQSLSWRAIRWRLEAFRTNQSFAEVVLMHTLRYRVEQVFLIHRKTGLLLEHVSSEVAGASSPDMISAMLTAIRDFVRDSFQVDEDSGLDQLRLGEFSVWIEQGPQDLATLALVIRGNAPARLWEKMRTVLDQIHAELGDELDRFSGDVSPFVVARPELEGCLLTEMREEELKLSRPMTALWRVGAGILILLLVWWGFSSWTQRRELSRLVDALEAEPGIVVTRAELAGGQLHLRGLRDPLAADPLLVAEGIGISPARIRGDWGLFYALDGPLIQSRAVEALDPPGGVQLAMEGTVLRATGTASREWITNAKALGPHLPGVESFETSGLKDFEEARAEELQAALEGLSVRFIELREPGPGQDDSVQRIIDALVGLEAVAAVKDWRVRVVVTGVTDEPGTAEVNQRIGRSRATFVLDLMRSRGITLPHLAFEIRNLEGSERAVRFEVDLPDRQSPPPGTTGD